MEDADASAGTHPYHAVFIFRYASYFLYSCLVFKEMPEFVSSFGSGFGHVQSTSERTHPHPLFPVAMNGEYMVERNGGRVGRYPLIPGVAYFQSSSPGAYP